LVALVAELETVGPRATMRNALRRSLADPGLDVVYLRVGSGGWIDEVGETMTAPVAVDGRAVTPIARDGKPIAALVHDPALLRNPARLRAAIGAASLAIDNEAVKADLRARLADAHTTLRRIVEGGDRERRRIERNLHDAAQQRLVGLALTLRLAGRKAAGDPVVYHGTGRPSRFNGTGRPRGPGGSQRFRRAFGADLRMDRNGRGRDGNLLQRPGLHNISSRRDDPDTDLGHRHRRPDRMPCTVLADLSGELSLSRTVGARPELHQRATGYAVS
jgi:hypothetical protein